MTRILRHLARRCGMPAAIATVVGVLTVPVLTALFAAAPTGVGAAGAAPARPVESVTPDGHHAFGAVSAPVTTTEYSDFL